MDIHIKPITLLDLSKTPKQRLPSMIKLSLQSRGGTHINIFLANRAEPSTQEN